MNAPDPTIIPDNPPRLLDTAEVAHQLNLTERQVARARSAGKLACVRLSASAVRHTQAQVDAYVAACTVEAVGERG